MQQPSRRHCIPDALLRCTVSTCPCLANPPAPALCCAGLLEFLAYEPFHHATVWRDLLQHYYEKQSAGGLLALRSLLRGVMLRRSKADVGE